MKYLLLLVASLSFLLNSCGHLTGKKQNTSADSCFGLAKEWDARFGGYGEDFLLTIVPSSDGGFLLGGNSGSDVSGDKTDYARGKYDYWVVKIDDEGSRVWDKVYGGPENDVLKTIVPTRDGGYLLGGFSESKYTVDKTAENKGESDFWIVKTDAKGNKQWEKSYGGKGSEDLLKIIITNDGGYLLAGSSRSGISGDKTTANHGANDYWLVKIDAVGNKIWDKSYGGDKEDILSTILATADGGYLLGGDSESGTSGERTQKSLGMFDFWLVKIDANGNKIWDKSYGGDKYDALNAIITTNDGNYLLGGRSSSDPSTDISEPNGGFSDYWIVKINIKGEKIWDKRFGEKKADLLENVNLCTDGGFLLTGTADSDIPRETKEGYWGIGERHDFWIVKTDANGKKQWDRRFGTIGFDGLNTVLPIGNGSYLLGGTSSGGKSGDKTQPSQGATDFWLMKVNECEKDK